jgi:predicted alpha/beta superfamily hydrolase
MVVVARTKRLRDAMIGVSLGSTIVLNAMVKTKVPNYNAGNRNPVVYTSPKLQFLQLPSTE